MTGTLPISISRISVNWNTREYLLRCLDALHTGDDRDTGIIVVDNASHDGSANAVRLLYPGITLMANTTNRGFAGGANDGVRASSGHYILILNPDIVLHSSALSPLVNYLEMHDDAGAVMPLLVHDDGNTQFEYVPLVPSIAQILFLSTALNHWTRRNPSLARRDLHFPIPQLDVPLDIEQNPGAFLLTRRSLWEETQGMDESYRLFFEDVDWSVRVSALGYRLILYPLVRVMHSGGRSFSPELGDWTARRYYISMVRFSRCHRGKLAACLIVMIFVTKAFVLIMVNVMGRSFVNPKVRATLRINATLQANILAYFYRRWVKGQELELPSMPLREKKARPEP